MTPGLLPTTPKDRLIFALDVDDLDAAERLVRKLAGNVGLFKVGPQLLCRAGPSVLEMIRASGAGVFLDLKFHDIPATVSAAAREAARQRVRMFTVHALGGRSMVKGAASEIQRLTLVPGIPPPLCLAVTVLTSHGPTELAELGITAPLVEATARLASLAVESGAHGVVASPQELRPLRRVLPPETIYVTPGIRGPEDQTGDQARVMGAKEAIEAGATYIVVGRPIRDAPDPLVAAQRIVDQIASAKLSADGG